MSEFPDRLRRLREEKRIKRYILSVISFLSAAGFILMRSGDMSVENRNLTYHL